jgi:type IV fimbrial biogenesis protein FimT
MQHRSSLRALSATAGFSLIELMVTVTLAAVLLGIAIPSFRGLIVNNRVITQSNELVGAINFARSEAITRNSNIVLCRATTAASNVCALSRGDWTNWIVRNAAATPPVVRRGIVNTYSATMRVFSDLSLDSVTFSSDGLARTGGVLVSDKVITVCTSAASSDNVRSVTLGAGSRLSTTKSTGTC